MRWKVVSVAVLGSAAFAVGLLWLLQGSDLVHMEPILCVGDCEPVMGHQPTWQVAGGALMLAGAGATAAALRRRHPRVDP